MSSSPLSANPETALPTAAQPQTAPPKAAAPKSRDRALVISIFGTHAERIGLPRTAVGGFSMYLTVPLFVFLHLTVVTFMYRFMLAPLLKLPRLKASDYIMLDRHTVEGLHWFDKANCWFCSYANGNIKLMNDQLDNLAASDTKAPMWAMPLVEAYVMVNVFFLFMGLAFTTIVLNILAKVLGLHRGSLRRIKNQLEEEEYASGYNRFHRKLIVSYKMVSMVIAYNLEQIESAWCPLKHIEREGQVLPVHHDKFLSRDDLGAMKEVLLTEGGTVSDKKPKW